MSVSKVAVSKQSLDEPKVVDVAARLVDRDGLDALTLTCVAAELGVRQPALYRHVDGFDGLLRSLSLRGREILADALAIAAIGVSRDDAVEAVGMAWRQVVRDHPGLYAATDRYPCAGDAELESAVGRVVEILGRSLSGYDLDDDHRVHAARTLRSAFHGFAHLESGDGHPLNQDLDESFRQMIQLICSGVRAMEDAAPSVTSATATPT